MKKLRRLVALLVILIIGSWGWYSRALLPLDSEDSVRRVVDIPSGSSVQSIASLLKDKEIIRSKRAFSVYARWNGKQSGLKAGSFVLRKSMSTPEVIDALERGFSGEATITIPEGYTVKDIDRLLAEKGIIEAGEIISCARTCDFSSFNFLPSGGGDLASRGGRLEGYLFPDTYFVIKDEFKPKFFLERLLTTFKKRVVDPYSKEIAASKKSLHEILTMASLVEEESRRDGERNVIAGILWKRQKAGMGLGVDAAVRYIIEKPADAITKSDLDIESPYNLRKFRGLPPGPIANPGLSSIKATLQPKDSTYWYYLHGSDGEVHYAVTNDEHNENRRLYIR